MLRGLRPGCAAGTPVFMSLMLLSASTSVFSISSVHSAGLSRPLWPHRNLLGQKFEAEMPNMRGLRDWRGLQDTSNPSASVVQPAPDTAGAFASFSSVFGSTECLPVLVTVLGLYGGLTTFCPMTVADFSVAMDSTGVSYTAPEGFTATNTISEVCATTCATETTSNGPPLEMPPGLLVCYEESLKLDSFRYSNVMPMSHACMAALEAGCNSTSWATAFATACHVELPVWRAGSTVEILALLGATNGVLAVLTQAASYPGFEDVAEWFDINTLSTDFDLCALFHPATVMFIWLYGSLISAPSDDQPPTWLGLPKIFRTNFITGPTMCKLTVVELVNMGVPLGTAHDFITQRSKFLFETVTRPIGAEFANPGSAFTAVYPGRPANVSISVVLENLYSIDEVAFTFSIGFLLILRYHRDCTAPCRRRPRALPPMRSMSTALARELCSHVSSHVSLHVSSHPLTSLPQLGRRPHH